MMKMKLAALMAAAMIATVAMPLVTVFAQGNDPEAAAAGGTTVVETTEAETEASKAETNPDGTEAPADGTDDQETESGDSFDLGSLDLSGIPGFDLEAYTGLLSELDPEVMEVLLKNPKLLAHFLPTLHVTVTDYSVTIAIDGREPEEDPVQTGRVRTNGSNLNVRTGPSASYDIINSLANGTEVQIMREENGWYQLEFPAKYGYVCGKYLELNDITPKETPEGYTFDIDGETLANFLSMFAGLFEEEPQVVPEVHGLTPDGNLTLVDDIGPVTGEGQQFITLVSKAGNVFYLIIDRDEKGEETVHFLNLVDERDLFTLMEEDEQTAYQEQLAAEAAAKEAAEKAAQEASQGESEEDPDADKDKEKESSRKGNMLPLLLIPLILAGAGGGWFYLQTKKKKQAASTPDPDADYTDDEDEEDYGAGDTGETEINVDSPDTGSDPYEDEILGDPDDELPDGEEL